MHIDQYSLTYYSVLPPLALERHDDMGVSRVIAGPDDAGSELAAKAK